MRKAVLLVSLIALVLPVTAAAQDWSAEQTEVWNTILAQWEASKPWLLITGNRAETTDKASKDCFEV